MVNVKLAADHLYGKLLLTLLSQVMSLMVYYCVIFPHELSSMRSGT